MKNRKLKLIFDFPSIMINYCNLWFYTRTFLSLKNNNYIERCIPCIECNAHECHARELIQVLGARDLKQTSIF